MMMMMVFFFKKYVNLFPAHIQSGHIYTSTGSYFIAPIESYTAENQNVLHKISHEDMLNNLPRPDDLKSGSNCGTCQDKGTETTQKTCYLLLK